MCWKWLSINLVVFSPSIKTEILASDGGNQCHFCKRFGLVEMYILRLALMWERGKWQTRSEKPDNSIMLYCQTRIESCPLHHLKVLLFFSLLGWMLITSVTSRHLYSAWSSVEWVLFPHLTNRGINRRKKKSFSSVLIKQPRRHGKKSTVHFLYWAEKCGCTLRALFIVLRELYLRWKELTNKQN